MKKELLKRLGGFTLLELLISIGILSILITLSANLYSYSQKKSRDARRKTDLENVRIALESYRSNNAEGNYSDSLNLLVPSYIPALPTDPLSNIYKYTYSYNGSDYTIGAYLELGGACSATLNCRVTGNQSCNYCLGPYGQK